MLVREIMTSPAFSVHVTDDLDAALQLMAEHKVTTLPVVDDNRHVVGVLSEVDLLRRAVEPDQRAHLNKVHESEPLPSSVGEIMTPNPRTSTPYADVDDLVELFITTKFKSLPVIDDHDSTLAGVISRSDVIKALWRPDEEVAKELRSVLDDQGQASWTATVTKGVVEISGPTTERDAGLANAIARSVLGVRRVHVELPG